MLLLMNTVDKLLQIDGQVMVDIPAFLEESRPNRSSGPWDPSYGYDSDAGFPPVPCNGRDQCQCPACMDGLVDSSHTRRAQNSTTAKFGNYSDLRPDMVAQLSDHQYFLCPQRIPVYFFKSRSWGE